MNMYTLDTTPGGESWPDPKGGIMSTTNYTRSAERALRAPSRGNSVRRTGRDSGLRPVSEANGKAVKTAPASRKKPGSAAPEKGGVLWTERAERDSRKAHDRLVGKELARLAASADAKEQLAAIRNRGKAPKLSEYQKSARELLSAPRPEREYAVDALCGMGHLVTLPSARKTGKTTLLANLGVAGLTESAFLDKFQTNLSVHRSIVAVNCEMTADDYEDIWRRLDPGVDPDGTDYDPAYVDPYSRLWFLHCREWGLKLDLMNDATAAELVDYLFWRSCSWLFLDPWKNLLAWAGIGINDNDGVNRLTTRIGEIQAAAELDMVVVPMHTTQARAESGEERGKGAGELEDGADALWRYVKDGHGAGASRFLSVTGRGGVGLEETEIIFDTDSQALSVGSRSRAEAKRDAAERSSVSVAEALSLELLRTGAEALTYKALEAVVPGTKKDKPGKIRDAVEAGEIVRQAEGPGKPTWFSPVLKRKLSKLPT